VAAAKDASANGLKMSKTDGFKYESSLFGTLFVTRDQQEGMRAFWGKGPPDFINQ
jgi:enoyl-CoA hydratase